MSTAREFIQDAYGNTLKSLFDQLYAAYVDAPADDASKKQAEQRFSTGVSLSVTVRDRALALLPPSA